MAAMAWRVPMSVGPAVEAEGGQPGGDGPGGDEHDLVAGRPGGGHLGAELERGARPPMSPVSSVSELVPTLTTTIIGAATTGGARLRRRGAAPASAPGSWYSSSIGRDADGVAVPGPGPGQGPVDAQAAEPVLHVAPGPRGW